jgi:hypothetical protein
MGKTMKGFAKNYTVVDNFLDEESFNTLKNSIIGNGDYPWYVYDSVANSRQDTKNFKPDVENNLWSWYAIHLVHSIVPQSSSFDYIFQLFKPKMDIKALIRIKVNYYPYTSEIKEHAKHIDFDYRHKGAVFSLNTCNGFTRMSNGDKVQSVANRMVFFDPSELHNSTTTSNDKGRYNINFNYF